MLHKCTLVCALGFALWTAPAAAEEIGGETEALRSQVEELRQRDAEQKQLLDEFRSELDELRAEQAGARVASMPEVSAPAANLWSSGSGRGAEVRLMDVSLDVLSAAGFSTERNEEIEVLQGGGHDPRQRGFTLQQVELSFMGAVDPYFTGEAHLVYFMDVEGESRFEIEEAFLTTQRLPYGLQLEAGHFFTEFGRINPRHPHQWHWQDAPIINARLFGEDGMRGPGVRLGWLAPLPWFSEIHVGLQNAKGETMASFLASDEFFEERGIAGRPFVETDIKSKSDLVGLLRWVNAFDLCETVNSQLGISFLRGPNASGQDGRTTIFGADFVAKWQPLTSDRGWPFVLFEVEAMRRRYQVDGFRGTLDDGSVLNLADGDLTDWGTYAQLLWGFMRNWAVGLRGEYATGSGELFDSESIAFVAPPADPFRDKRYRIAPLLIRQLSEYSRLRLQYNYDEAEHLENGAHSVWLGFEISLGAHPAHAY